MKIIENTEARTVLLFRPPLLLPAAICLTVTFFAGWGWHETGSWKWLVGAIVAAVLSVMVLLASCFNRRTLTFDWRSECVDGLLHNWNPLFKDETEHHSLKAVALWTVGQERSFAKEMAIGKTSKVWQVGFERTDGKAVLELFFERTFREAREKALLMARHNSKPVVVRSAYDELRADPIMLAREPETTAPGLTPPVWETSTDKRLLPYAHSGLLMSGEGTSQLDVSLHTDRRKIPSKGGPIRRWPFMLFEGALCLVIGACFPLLQRHPHPLYQLALAYGLIAFPILLAGCSCLWVGLRDLTGRTRIEVHSGRVRMTQTVLGGMPYRTKEDSVRQWGGGIVSKLGYNPCLLVLFCDKEYHLGVGLNPQELLRIRRALNNAVLSQ